MKIEELEQIIKILKQNEVNEFEFDNDGVRIRLTRGSQLTMTQVNRATGASVDIAPAITIPSNGYAAEVSVQQAPQKAVEDTSHLFKVESPIVGTFYRKPSPDAEFFVTEGTTVQKGQTLCIIEAMKLMNEIEAPISGKVEKILANDSQVVEFGEVLFFINPKM